MSGGRRAIGVLAALPGLPAALRRDRPVPIEPSAPEPAATPPTRGVRIARRVLVGAGVLLLAIAFGALVSGVPFGQWRAIGIWLVVALILHDGLLAPLLIVGARLLRRASGRLPWGALAAVQVVVAVGFSITLVAIPGIRSQQLGARNSSVLPFDYPAHLAVAWAVVGLAVAAAVVLGAIRRSHRTD